jgi:peptidoglycan/xylan/chitin deacetylase (PgdA/CDA1 family)
MPYSVIHSLEAIAYRAKNRLLNHFDPPVVVLLYHRVTTLRADPQLLAVSPDNFRAHLQFLKNNFPLVRFEEDWSKVRKPAIAITFDDGYADNVLEALPIIEEIGVPATFFVSTGTFGTWQEFWWDELEHLVLGEHDFPDQFVLEDSRFGQTWPTAAEAERHVLFEEIQPSMRKLDADRREGWLRQFRRWAQTEAKACESHQTMTVEDLQRLARSRWVTVGAHTVTHSALSCLTPEKQRQEIMSSKTQLESWLGHEITVFSYPFGTKEDYDQLTVSLCKEAGFVKAAANFPAQAHSWTDPFEIPRQLVRNWRLEVFTEKLKDFLVS